MSTENRLSQPSQPTLGAEGLGTPSRCLRELLELSEYPHMQASQTEGLGESYLIGYTDKKGYPVDVYKCQQCPFTAATTYDRNKKTLNTRQLAPDNGC